MSFGFSRLRIVGGDGVDRMTPLPAELGDTFDDDCRSCSGSGSALVYGDVRVYDKAPEE